MAAKKYMTSYYVLYACFAIIVLFFAAFFGYGYDNPVGDYNAPVCTEGLMWLMYGMFAVTCLLALWSVVRGIKISMGSKEATSAVCRGLRLVLFLLPFW